MKIGKERIHNLPMNDVTSLGAYADRLQREAEARGQQLPPPVRLQIGEPDFRTPTHISQAAQESILNERLTYAPAAGWPWLRALLAEKVTRVNGYSVQAEHTAVALGGTGALLAALTAIVGPGDEVLLPDPCWPLYMRQLAACGATAVTYPLDPKSEWYPDIARLETLVTTRTKVLLINSPGNPTGAVFPREIMQALLDFACRHDLYLLSDECYDQVVFEGEHISPATLLAKSEFENGRFIGVYTFSKTYAMTGWRIGYVVASTRLIETITAVLDASYTSIATPVQRAAAAALTGPQECALEMCRAYQRRRDIAVSLLKDYGRYVYTPHGAFYTLIDVRGAHGLKGRQFALDLLKERNVAVAPGSGFGRVSDEYVRISLAGPEEEIARGVKEVCAFADRD
jgi:aspartate aminotransferase/aminotransferase